MRSIKPYKRTALAVAVCVAFGAGLSACGGDDTEAAAGVVSQELDIVANADALQNVPADARPKVRWWWPQADLDSKELESEMNALKEVGFGGVEPVLLNRLESKYLDWAKAGFSAATGFVANLANSLGLRFDTTLGPAWPMTAPSVDDPAKRLSMQDLHYGVVTVTGPVTFSGAVPDDSATRATGQQQKDLIAVTAARVVSADTLVTLDPDSAVDLTSKVAADGTIQWSVPAGTWKLFGFWMRPTYQRAIGATDATKGWLVVDHLSQDAVKATLDDYDRLVFGDAANGAALRKNGGHVFEDSLEVTHGTVATGQSALFWTPTFQKEFTARRGYSPTKFLPAMFSEFTFPSAGGARVKNDYDTTLYDLYIDKHIKPITEWAKNHGLTYRAQAYGTKSFLPERAMRLAAAVPIPDVESFGFGDPLPPAGMSASYAAPGSSLSRDIMDRYRQVVSGAHVSGAKEVSNEWGAAMFEAFGQDPGSYKMLADRSFAAGVTTQILHGLSYASYNDGASPTWPGWCTWCSVPSGPITLQVSESWNPGYPQWKHWPRLTGYLGRISAVLRNGKPRVDLALLDDRSVIGTSGLASSADDTLRLKLIQAGYTWDAMDTNLISQLSDASGGRLLPDGPSYKAVVVNNQVTMSVATARKLLQNAKNGLPVIFYGAVPVRGTGFRDAASEDAELAGTLQQLMSLGNVRRISTPADLVSTLGGLSVSADFRPAQTSEIIPVRRSTTAGDIWFLYNNSTQAVSTDATFAATGVPTRIDPWTGNTIRPATYRASGGQVTLPLTLAAGETAILTFNKSARAETHFVATTAAESFIDGANLTLRDTTGGAKNYTLSNGGGGSVQLPTPSSSIAVTGPWQLNATTVAPSGTTQVSVQLPQLLDWRSIPQLTSEAGTGVYTTTVNVPAGAISTGYGLRLDPGVVNGTVRAWVNGVAVAMPTVAPFQVDVTRLLHAGSNDLKFEVATTLINKAVALGKAGTATWTPFSRRATKPYGLVGPVTLVPYTYATVTP